MKRKIRLTEKDLSRIIRKNLSELPMDFDTPDRPHPSLQDKLAAGDTPIEKVPLPKTGREPEQNFQELLASERYKQVVDRVRRYAGLGPQQNVQNDQRTLIFAAMEAKGQIEQIENAHLEELSNLAIQLVIKEMGIPEGSVQWDCKIEQPDMTGFKQDPPNEENQPEVNPEAEMELAGDLEQLNLERAKRRLINAMIQGSAAKGQYMFHLVEPELNRITGDPTLINKYGLLMSILDTQYWQFPDEMIQGAAGQSLEGKEEVDRTTDPPTIYARGTSFPILVHEIIKAVMELFSHQGEPEDKEMFQQVMELEDTLEKEVWDLRLGPSIWNRIREQFPEEVITDEAKYELQNWILVEIFKLPAKEFLILTREVISGSPQGKQLLQEIYDSVVALLNGVEPEEETQTFHNDLTEIAEDVSDEDIDSFLKQLTGQGMGEPQGETPPEEPTGNVAQKLAGMGLNALNVEMNQAIDNENWGLAQEIQKMIERKQGR